MSLDETIDGVLKQALDTHDTVIVDDFQFVSVVACCAHAYPRNNFLAAALLPLAALARDHGKKLVFTSEGMPLMGLDERFPIVSLAAFTERDYEAICASYLGASLTPRIDCGRVHRFAPKLTARQLRHTCVALRDADGLDTERFIEYLREHHLASNVDLDEVQAVELQDLKGIDDVIEAWRRTSSCRWRTTNWPRSWGCSRSAACCSRARRAPARRRSAGRWRTASRASSSWSTGRSSPARPTSTQRVHHIFEAAKQNAPAVIFIDDSDVIFESGDERGCIATC